MIKKIAILLVIIIFSNVFANENETYSLTIKVNGLRNSKGAVQFSLYNQNGSIPDENYDKYFKIQIGEIYKDSSSITFDRIPKGVYAVNILHDENSNGKIDKGFILPVEGIGFSNYNSLGLLNRPNFSKAKFELKSNKTLSVKIIYM